MIKTKKDLKEYIKADREANLGLPMGLFKYAILVFYKSDGYRAYHYLKILRKFEYYANNSNILFGKFLYYFYKYKHHRLSVKYNFNIGPNMVGKGFWIPHTYGGGFIVNCLSMGTHCNVNVGVVIGNAKFSQNNRPTIGDNVSFCVGSKAYGKIFIGNNVVVLPNSVVINDIPSNCIIAGNPAKIIRTT